MVVSISIHSGDQQCPKLIFKEKREFKNICTFRGWTLVKCNLFDCQLGRVKLFSNIHMKHFYTTELGKYAGKKIFTSEPHMSALFHVMRQLMWKNIQ